MATIPGHKCSKVILALEESHPCQTETIFFLFHLPIAKSPSQFYTEQPGQSVKTNSQHGCTDLREGEGGITGTPFYSVSFPTLQTPTYLSNLSPLRKPVGETEAPIYIHITSPSQMNLPSRSSSEDGRTIIAIHVHFQSQPARGPPLAIPSAPGSPVILPSPSSSDS